MLLKLLNLTLMLSGFLHIVLIILHKLHFHKMKDNVKLSHYVAVIVISLFVYIICAFLIALLNPNTITKALMILFALMPFIIGQLATYEKEKIYTTVQLIFVAISMLCV